MKYAFLDRIIASLKQSPSVTDVTHTRISSLDDAIVEQVMSTRDIQPALTACHDEVRAAFGFPVTTDEVTFCIASTIAHQFRPYGDSHAMTWEAVTHEPVLNCGNYPIVVHHILPPPLQEKIRFVGFMGGLIGNHLQIYIPEDSPNNRSMIVDPTAACVAFTDLDSLLQGHLPTEAVHVLNRRPDPKLDFFYGKVDEALSSGSYKPTDLLSYSFSFDMFTGADPWPYRTPGGERLYRQNNPCSDRRSD